MGICYLSRRTPYDIEYTKQMCVYPIGKNGMPEGNIIIPDVAKTLSKYICSENPQVTGIYIPDTVTNFENDCFLNCPNITRVDCPDGIETISTQCFQNCSSLETVVLPLSLKKIKARAFKKCPVLKTLIFNSKTNEKEADRYYYAEDEAFCNCDSLTNDDITNIAEYLIPQLPYETKDENGKTITVSGERIFADNPRISDVEIYRLGNYMFDNCHHLKRVVIKSADVNKEIAAEFPFNDCYSLETVVLPEGIISIGEKVFLTTDTSSEKSHIININIPNTCESIKYKAFYNAPYLRNLFIPKSVKYIGKQTFEKCDLSELEVEAGINCVVDTYAFKSTNINNANVNTLCLNQLYFEQDSNGNAIVTQEQYSKCNNLTEIVTNQSTVGMFQECKFLNKAVINHGTSNIISYKSINTLFAKMFKNCISLVDVIINDNTIEVFGESIFDGCKNLKNVTFANNYKVPKTYGKRMFAATGLEEISLQDGALEISEEMFKDCRQLKHINIPDNILKYGANAFNGCSDFKGTVLEEGDTEEKLVVNSKIRSIGTSAFEMCGQLEKVVFPAVTMDSLGDYIFKDCIHLREVQMPTKITTIGKNIFQGCISLQYLNPAPIYNYYDSFFANLTSLEEITIPSGVTKLDLNIFANCTNLKKVTLPVTINSWGSLNTRSDNRGTYYYSNIDEVRNNVYYNNTKVNKNLYVFLNCPNLIDVVLGVGWNQTFDLHSLNLTFDSIVQMLINIANVSSYGTKPTLTLGANNLAKIPKTENDIYEKDEEGNIKTDEDGNNIEIPGFRKAWNAYDTAKNTKKWNIT